MFVEFGSFSQWFPFPASENEAKQPVAFSLISSAHAQAPVPTPAVPQGTATAKDPTAV